MTKIVSWAFIILCFGASLGLELSKWVSAEGAELIFIALIFCTIISLETLRYQGYKD